MININKNGVQMYSTAYQHNIRQKRDSNPYL